MVDNIIKFADIQAARQETDTWEDLSTLLNGIMNIGTTPIPWPDNIADDIENEFVFGESMNAMSRFLIGHLYSVDVDPAGSISDDMVFISMLFESAIREHKTGEYERSSGQMNTFYKHFNKIRDDIQDDGDL
jgi:hypothetical protein